MQDLAREKHAIVHGFIKDASGEHWCPSGDPQATGWTAYLRRPGPLGEPVITHQQDFASLEAAVTYAGDFGLHVEIE